MYLTFRYFIKLLGTHRREFLKAALGSLLLLAGCKSVQQPKRITRLAFGSCADQDNPQPVWDEIAAAGPDAFVFIGDNIYADTEDMAEMARRYDKLAAKPQYAVFRARYPIYATWDDHDFGINDGGAEYPKKEESKQLFLDFFGEPQDSERRRRPGVYTSYTLGPEGADVQLILLDLRTFRSPLLGSPDHGGYFPNPDPNATIMGERQWQWLEHELSKPARVRVIASSVQCLSNEQPWEKWANFPADKERLLAMLDRLQVRNAVIISGDMHYGELSAERTPAGTTLYDLTSSGMNYSEAGAHFPNSNRLAIHDTTPNFGMLEFDWGKSTVNVSLQVRTDKGRTVIRRDITL